MRSAVPYVAPMMMIYFCFYTTAVECVFQKLKNDLLIFLSISIARITTVIPNIQPKTMLRIRESHTDISRLLCRYQFVVCLFQMANTKRFTYVCMLFRMAGTKINDHRFEFA